MLRHLMSLCIVLCLFASMTRADDKPVSAAPTTEGEGAGAGEVVVPAEVHRLEGKVVKIYYDVDLLGKGEPSVLHTQYLTIVLEQAGVTVQQCRTLNEKKQAQQPDVVIFGEMTEAKFTAAELADPFNAKKAKDQRQEIQKYKAARPKLETDATAAGARVIKFQDVAKALGVHVTQAQMVEALNARTRETLKRELPDFKADGMSLSDIIDFLRDVAGANIFVNWRALEAAGVDRKAPLTVSAGKMPLSEALHELLTAASGGDEEKLGYDVQEGVIVISTADDLKKKSI